jgi:oligopeptide transport system ATP-binding protein
VSDRMAVMYLGSLIEIGPADSVYFSPLHPYTQALIAANPEPDPRAARQRAALALKGDARAPIDLGQGCRFADRCPRVMDHCRNVRPELAAPASAPATHAVACHLYS